MRASLRGGLPRARADARCGELPTAADRGAARSLRRARGRFRADLERLAGRPAGRVGVAVSGGPDSVALLLLASAACPGAVQAATVDHGLRPESAAEAESVAETCARLDVPHAVLRPATPLGGNLQSAARGARYALLERGAASRGWTGC